MNTMLRAALDDISLSQRVCEAGIRRKSSV